jgi:predicted TIM-barrel fold metal-dependent hydrolase
VLAPAVDALSRLPALVIDHLGMTEAGLPVVLDLARAGAKVKASGFGRVALDVPRALERIAAAAPTALMFGSDLPSVRAARPFAPADIDLLRDVLGEALAHAALHDTAAAFYRVG